VKKYLPKKGLINVGIPAVYVMFLMQKNEDSNQIHISMDDAYI
jgi:hypothetical protein